MRPNTPRPIEGCLEDMIARHMATPGHVAERQPRADFVMSGIRAASAASPMTREKILSDLADVIDCDAKDLDFLFAEFEMPITKAANYEVMVPDFQRELLAVAE